MADAVVITILALPALAAALSYSPLGTRWGRATSTLTALAVTGLALYVDTRVGSRGELRAFGTALAIDGLSALYLTLVAFVGLTSSIYAWGYLPARHELDGGRRRTYHALFNLFFLSLLAVPLLSDLVLIWIAIDLTTLFSAFLVAFESKAPMLEAAWKYVTLTTMGALIALPGFLILIFALRSAGLSPHWESLTGLAGHASPTVVFTAFLLVLVGFGAKAGLVPMHTWLPDAHSQAPASVCAVLSGVETTAPLYVLFRLFPVLWRLRPELAGVWYIVPGLISVGAAALLLIQVRDFKRLFAFSTVEHMGILLVACGLATPFGRLGAVYQMLGHSLIKPFCFYVAGLVTVALGTQELGSTRGLLRRSPAVGISLILGGLAIAGAPPFSIFASEVSIVRGGLAGRHWAATALLVLFIVVAFCAIMYHVIGMTFGEADQGVEPTPSAAHQATSPAHGEAVTAAQPLPAGANDAGGLVPAVDPADPPPGAASLDDAADRPLPLPRSAMIALVLAGLPALVLGIYLPSPLAHLVHQAASALGGTP
jgi:hydrogenase-4 component F